MGFVCWFLPLLHSGVAFVNHFESSEEGKVYCQHILINGGETNYTTLFEIHSLVSNFRIAFI